MKYLVTGYRTAYTEVEADSAAEAEGGRRTSWLK